MKPTTSSSTQNTNLQEKPKNFLFRKMNKKISYPLVFGLGTLVIVASGYFVFNEQNNKNNNMTDNKSKKSTITIESEPAGISMKGKPWCDAEKLGKTTPYDCEVPDYTTETVIIAPGTFEKDEKTYTFSTWEGCSESNADWSICKVNIEKKGNKKIKAHFSPANSSGSIKINNPDKVPVPNPPIAHCQTKKQNSNGYVDCLIDIFDVSTNFSLGMEYYPTKGGSSLYGLYNPGILISCTNPGDCDPINTKTNITFGVNKPTKLLIKVPYTAAGWFSGFNSNDLQNVTFDNWQSSYLERSNTLLITANYIPSE